MPQQLFAIALVVPDYDAALAFYVDRLGFTLDQDEDLGGSKRWVRITPPGGVAGSIILAKADGQQQAAAIGNQTGGRVGFFLTTDDFARDYAMMLAQGVEFEEKPRHEPYGTVAVWRDPFGNRWDLLEFS
ncbi:Glyoxalase/Bleomycin resistance protein/Dioxygenase superfamily protein [Falsiruegeria litorea R37]|uniref:Glyoxalase/Bleomycin resistance protein/Dioxygenase superfamily protein n=1 Tax=Falsiruegeria litorea R37 TaxID=1200284 RepID=A0A1Y5SF68_9RHOB|nr:VOC family protein [Falsiruegeria litorea]SLN36311.1 Glyoxalase/Bleomycin resistance protein/Dioxygenase superfamily protein [Falsiruegeria litorea R37]